MRKIFTKSIRSASILLYFLFLIPFQVNGADQESANELYVKSGLEKHLQDIGPALLAGYRHHYEKTKEPSERDKTIYRNIEQVIDTSFDTQKMKETVVSGVMRDIKAAEMKSILAWLNSPEGKEITALEEAAGTPKGLEETQRYIKNIKTAPITQERMHLIKELNSTMNITETTLDIAWSTQFALSMTLAPKGKRLNRQEIEKRYEESQKDKRQIEPMVEHQVHGSLLYTYQTLPDEVLKTYISFLRSEGGQAYSSTTSSHMLRAITESCLQFAAEISQL